MAKKQIFTSPSNFYHIFENSPCAKIFQLHLEIDKVGKWSIPVVYIDGIITALCAWVFDWQVILVKIPPWGKLLQFWWGKLLHCNCNTWGKNGVWIGLKCNRITLVIKLCPEIHNIYAFYMTKKFKWFLSKQRLKSMCIIFNYSKRADKRTKQRTRKQTQWHMHTPTYPHRHMWTLYHVWLGQTVDKVLSYKV